MRFLHHAPKLIYKKPKTCREKMWILVIWRRINTHIISIAIASQTKAILGSDIITMLEKYCQRKYRIVQLSETSGIKVSYKLDVPSWPMHTPLWIIQQSPNVQLLSATLYLEKCSNSIKIEHEKHETSNLLKQSTKWMWMHPQLWAPLMKNILISLKILNTHSTMKKLMMYACTRI